MLTAVSLTSMVAAAGLYVLALIRRHNGFRLHRARMAAIAALLLIALTITVVTSQLSSWSAWDYWLLGMQVPLMLLAGASVAVHAVEHQRLLRAAARPGLGS